MLTLKVWQDFNMYLATEIKQAVEEVIKHHNGYDDITNVILSYIQCCRCNTSFSQGECWCKVIYLKPILDKE